MSVAELEPAIKNPLEDMEGLSDEDNEKAIQLRLQLKGAVIRERALRKRRKESYHRSFGREINEMVEELQAKHDVHKVSKSANKHYQLNKEQYQIQAVKDVTTEGVHTNFGYDEDEEPHKSAQEFVGIPYMVRKGEKMPTQTDYSHISEESDRILGLKK
jgi:lysine/ornithine N-monooxygenase